MVCALASYLHARQNNGNWLVRIEDIDTPRVNPNSIPQILRTLREHGLLWDEDVVYQSQRGDLYEAYLATLQQQNVLYGCACTRKEIRERGNAYNGFCRQRALPFKNHAIRFKQTTPHNSFIDLARGNTRILHSMAHEDPVLKRADGIYCYHLAVVVDDIEQCTTHIVRGGDLLDTTAVHLSLYHAFKQSAPSYMHIPIVVHTRGEKLSKQNLAPSVNNKMAIENLKLALVYLGIDAKKMPHIFSIDALLHWAIENWSTNLLPKQSELLISFVNGVYLSD